MAKENTIYLIGIVSSVPEIRKSKKTQELKNGMFLMNTARRSYATEELLLRGTLRTDTPAIVCGDEKIIREQIMPLRKNDAIFVKGTLVTQETSKISYCPHCGAKNIKEKGVIVYVRPIHIVKIASDLSEKEAFDFIKDNAEMNGLFAYGVLCANPSYYNEGRKKSISFPMVTERKYRIKEDGEDKNVDYPRVVAFGPTADELKESIHMGSSVYINGALECREISEHKICSQCQKEYDNLSTATEIIPYSVEYIWNCDPPKRKQDETMDEIQQDYLSKYERESLGEDE